MQTRQGTIFIITRETLPQYTLAEVVFNVIYFCCNLTHGRGHENTKLALAYNVDFVAYANDKLQSRTVQEYVL